MLDLLHVEEAMIFADGQIIQTEVPVQRMVKLSLDGVCPVISTEAHPAFSGAKVHSSNTAEMPAMMEALYFLGPRGPAAGDVEACIYYDSKHAAGVCLGVTQARTHVQLALACQRAMLCAQLRLRLTMQHVHGHFGNLGNECADDLAHLFKYPATTLPLAGLIKISTHLLVVMDVTTLARFWKDEIASEMKPCQYPLTGISFWFFFSSGSLCSSLPIRFFGAFGHVVSLHFGVLSIFSPTVITS